MSDSPLLGLPFVAASQAQKHVTVNDAFSLLDGLIHLSVISRVLTTPPSSPADGERYLIAASPTGLWVGHAGHIAIRVAGAWRFMVPRSGWRIWIEAESVLLVYNGTVWVAPPAPSVLQNLALLGVNATADTTNKVAVNSAAVLFNNVGAGVQFKINKNASADTASLLFQTGFSGRAEIGTTGDDDLHFKVSANGSIYNESLIVAAASGKVMVKNNLLLEPQAADPATPGNGQLWYNSTSGKFRCQQNGSSIDLVGAGGSVTDGTKGDITVSAGGTVWTVANTAVSNAKLAQMPATTLKGNSTGASASVIDLSTSQVTAMLDSATGSLKGLLTAADFTKLAGIASGATANAADATLLNRANHNGTQAASTITGLGTLATQSGSFSGSSSGTNTGDQTFSLSGDATGSGSNAVVVALATVNASVGSFTNATITVDGKGRITAASTGASGGSLAVQEEGVALTAAATSLNFTGPEVIATNIGAAVTVTSNPWGLIQARSLVLA